MKDQFWKSTDKLQVDDRSPFNSTNEEDHHYLTLFDDHSEGYELDKSSVHPEY